MEMKILIILILAIFTMVCAALFYHEYMTTRKRIQDLEEDVTDIKDKMKKMEDANRKRMPYEAMEAVLNGMAALDVLEREVDFEKSGILNARAHFSKALSTGTNREEKQ